MTYSFQFYMKFLYHGFQQSKCLENGRDYYIDEVKDKCRTASLRAANPLERPPPHLKVLLQKRLR